MNFKKLNVKKILALLIKSIGIIIFFYIINNIGIHKILDTFSKISIFPFFITVLLLILAYIVKAMRWKIICKGYNSKLSLLFCIKIYMIGSFLGLVTPGHLGDFGRAYYLHEKDVPLSKGLFSVILDRIYDLFFLLIFAIFSIIYLHYSFNFINFDFNCNSILLIGLFIIGIALFSVIFYFNPFGIFIGIKKKISEIYQNFIKFNLTVSQYFSTIILTIITLFIGYGLFYYLAYSLNIRIHFIDIIACAFIISFLQLIPITILGIGTRDMTLVYFFKLNQIDTEWAITLSLIILLSNICAVIPGMIFFIHNKKTMKDYKIFQSYENN